MTDSESDTSNNVFNFQNDNTTVINAKGPNTNFSCRNPMTSTMYNMSRNYERVERQRYAESAYDQRSMYYRRETSPMSIQSACDIRPRNFQQYAGMSSQQSLFNGRSGSPMSMRSIDSSASVSAADIVFAFKNVKFNKNDFKVIRDAYQKLLKQRVRRRIEKRRNMRQFLKGRKRSRDDSGDQASDSSVSSDDYRSVKTYKENMFSSISARMDLTDFRKTFKDRNMLKDSSNNFSQNTLKNKFSVAFSSVNNNTQNFNNTLISNQSNSMPTQRDRFRNGFLLPSQRFNRSVASSAILENPEKPHKITGNNQLNNVKNHYAQNNRNKNNCPSGSEEEEIFSEMTAREKITFNIDSQHKRNLDSEDESNLPVSKRSRITSPAKSAPYNKKAPQNLKNINPSNNNVELSNGFQFVKPSLPVRKSKHREQEKLIAKSSQPLIDYVEPMPKKVQENIHILQPSNLQEKSSDNLTQLDQSETTQNSDVSSRPSFIKRKLFTQNLDVAEKANLSTDAMNSPQSSVCSLQKEKNKSRKLVTNQSCLNREVEDDNNLLDLIHKIVPPDRMNLTNQTTINQNKNNKKDNEAKWDVTSVIAICNEDDGSDTYTDEEIFKADNTIKLTAKNKDINSKANPIDKVVTKTQKLQGCQVMLKKFESNNTLQKQVVNQNFNLTHNNDTKNNTKSLVKTFWDTDCESDVDCQTVLPRSHVTDILKKANLTLDTTKQDFKNPIGYARTEISNKNLGVPNHLNNSLMNNTVTTFNSMLKMNTSTFSVRSHRTSRKKKCCNETCANETKSKLDNTGHEKKDNSEEPAANNLGIINAKTKMIQSKNSTEILKSKLNKQNEKNTTVARSTSQSIKSPKEKKSIKDKQAVSPKNKNKKSESKSKLEKSSSVNNKKSNTEAQNNKTAIKNKEEKQIESTKNDHKSKIQSDKQQSKKLKTPKTKPKSKSEHTQSKKNKPVSQPTNLNLNNTVEPIQNTSFVSGRPIRSCRTSNQSSSIELSGSAQLNNTSVNITRSLRSRVINLSSSIENITIKIKPKNKNNKNISQINTRKSDVSFSLGSEQQTPVSKKTSPRSRAIFCKGRRKP